jgi:DNA-binding MarR family transcriptional regulator
MSRSGTSALRRFKDKDMNKRSGRAAAAPKRGKGATRTDGNAPLGVLMKFRQVFRAAKLHFGAVERSVGVSGAQLWTLQELRDHPGLKVSELAAAMALHQSTVSNLLEALSRRKLLTRRRDDQDQRVVRVYLTAAGAQIVRRAPGPARGVLPDALDSLSPTALRRLDHSLSDLLQAMKVKAPSGARTHLQELLK